MSQGASSAVTTNENVKEGDTQNSNSQLEQKLDKPNSAEDGAASASALIQSPKESTSDDQASPSGLGNENKSEANVTPDSGIQDDSGTPGVFRYIEVGKHVMNDVIYFALILIS